VFRPESGRTPVADDKRSGCGHADRLPVETCRILSDWGGGGIGDRQ
jgi:hypothetical protein